MGSEGGRARRERVEKEREELSSVCPASLRERRTQPKPPRGRRRRNMDSTIGLTARYRTKNLSKGKKGRQRDAEGGEDIIEAPRPDVATA